MDRVRDDEWVVGAYNGDSGYIANKYGQNPNTQGRDFLRCIGNVPNPGAVIGVNGLAGNLGIAVAAIVTGLLVKWIGWRAAFAVPGIVSIAAGIVFAIVCPKETEAPSKRKGKAKVVLTPAMLVRAFTVMTAAAVAGSLLFNFTTNGNSQLLFEGFRGVLEDPQREQGHVCDGVLEA